MNCDVISLYTCIFYMDLDLRDPDPDPCKICMYIKKLHIYIILFIVMLHFTHFHHMSILNFYFFGSRDFYKLIDCFFL